ncbi:hypothetical protein [Streptomyces sp. NPDC016172]|uniref:hypothetical protein n=1 Tax=Streptomyces sp. NPDC016172 TaxID=3364964 RepID=UPI0037024BC4
MAVSSDVADGSAPAGRLIVDVSEIAGFARVSWPANCAPESQTKAVCAFPEMPAGTDSVRAATFGLRFTERHANCEYREHETATAALCVLDEAVAPGRPSRRTPGSSSGGRRCTSGSTTPWSRSPTSTRRTTTGPSSSMPGTPPT